MRERSRSSKPDEKEKPSEEVRTQAMSRDEIEHGER
jgi:hypothetical protein